MSGRDLNLEIDGKPIEAKWWGPGPDDAPTIVMLHEGLGCVALWRDVPEKLAVGTGCGVLAYSRFGYGASAPAALPRPLTYMHDEALKNLGPIMDLAGIKRAILLGHSDGGSIAAIYAGGVQDFRLRGAILIAAHFFTEDPGIASIEAAKSAYETTNLREKLARYHADVDNAFRGWNGAWLDPEFRKWRIDDYIPTIRIPLLLIQGSADEYGTLAQFDRVIEEAYCPVQTEVIDGAGHAPHLSHPAQTLRLIEDFVARILELETIPSYNMQNNAYST
jgi:pimeloyl-ACP methyl ester carboxylesterase